ncbi:MAG TPA: glycosyltransferase family 2 protein [Mycobacteriales bacterium]|nr:glycosyltransferase family 2 protein [Mycobacteriales bacterium]
MTPSTCAVIVTWNSAEHITACAQSLVDEGVTEVVVVDNASADDTVARARAVPGVTVIANPDNRGLAPGNNQGIRATSSDIVIVSNPDVIYPPGSVAALVDCLVRHPDAAIAVPRMTHLDGSLQTSAGDLPRLREAFGGRRLSQVTAAGPGSGAWWWDGWAHDEEVRIGHGAEAAYAVRRAAIDAAGLQDEEFWLDWEGVEWAARFGDAGYEVWFTPTSQVVHVGAHSIVHGGWRWVRSSHKGMYRYFRLHGPRIPAPLLATAIAGRAAAKALWFAIDPDMARRATKRRRD